LLFLACTISSQKFATTVAITLRPLKSACQNHALFLRNARRCGAVDSFPYGKRDVSAVSCACKDCEITVPCLYDTIIWTWNMHANPTELCNPPIHLLLRSIVETLQLGAYVKHLSFRGTKIRESPLTSNRQAPFGPQESSQNSAPANSRWWKTLFMRRNCF
jgi:hypothetical protein